MATNGGRIEFQVGLNVDTKSLDSLKKSLQDIQKIKPASFQGSKYELDQIKKTASDVEMALKKAFNANIGSLNVSKLNNELFKTSGDINNIYHQFAKLGSQGQAAFTEIAKSALTSNLQLKETKSIISEMGTTLMNTLKWNISSSAINGFTQGIQSAFTYVKSLDAALTDIRIVTGDSQQKMQRFAQSANKAAQSLGRSTMDYTKSALTFYQQGLDEESVQARTEAVLKAQNITGAGAQMADYMTAVWNGYKVANEQAELYIDKLAAVADSSASDMSQLAIAMSRVASTANNMGVSVDQLNAQIATVVATTRQAPEAVGTAFKTIYTRLNDVKTGADGAEISLGNYSKKMAEVGFNVLDTNGRLRDTGQIMEEIGNRWGTLTKEQQIYLASTMGGQRQVNYLMSLFQNWTTYSDLLNTSLESQGTLSEKNARYMESLGAKMQQLATAQEHVKAAMVDTDSWKAVLQILTTVVDTFGTFIDSIGGGGTALLALGSILTQVFSGVISTELNKIITNIQNIKSNAEALRNDIILTEKFGKSQGMHSDAIKSMVNAKEEIQQYYSIMSEGQINSYNEIVKKIGALESQKIALQKNVDEAKELEKELKKSNTSIQTVESMNSSLKDSLKNMPAIKVDDLEPTKKALLEVESTVNLLNESLGESAPKEIKNFTNALKEIKEGGEVTEKTLHSLRGTLKTIIEKTGQKIDINLNTQQTEEDLSQVIEKLNLTEDAAKSVQEAMEQRAGVETWVQSISAVGRFASALSSLHHVFEIIKDDNLSFGEKTVQVMMSVSFALGSLISAYQGFTKVLLTNRQAQIADMAVQEAKQKLTTTLALAKKLEEGATWESLSAKEQEILANYLQIQSQKGLAAANSEVMTSELAQAAAAEFSNAVKAKQALILQAVKQKLIALKGVLLTNPYVQLALAIGALILVYDKLTLSAKEAQEAVDKSREAYKEEENKLKSLESELNSTADKIKELSNRESLSIVEQEELANLRAVNAELIAQKENLQEITAQKQQQLALDIHNKINKTTGDGGYGQKKRFNVNIDNDAAQGANLNDLPDAKNTTISKYLKEMGVQNQSIGITDLATLKALKQDLAQKTAEDLGVSEATFEKFKEHINELVKESEDFFTNSFKDILADYKDLQKSLKTAASQEDKTRIENDLATLEKSLDSYYLSASKKSESIVAGIIKGSTKINQEKFDKLKEDLKDKDLQSLSDKQLQDFLKSHFDEKDVNNINESISSIGMSTQTLLKILQGSKLNWSEFLNAGEIEGAKTSLDSLQQAVDLLSKQEAGTKLSKKEIAQLEEDLASLGNDYGDLTYLVQILSNTSISGTKKYTNALHQLRAALIQIAVASGDLSKATQNIFSLRDLDTYKNSVKHLFDNTYNQQVINKMKRDEVDQETGDTLSSDKIAGLEQQREEIYKNSNLTKDYQEQLLKLSQNYSTCSSAALKFTEALATKNDITIKNAEADLRASIRAGQLARMYGLQQAQVASLTASKIEEARTSLGEGESLSNQDAEDLARQAEAYIRINRGIGDLKDNYNSYLQILNKVKQAQDETQLKNITGDIKSSQKLFKSFNGIKNILADIANISQDEIKDDWIQKYADDLQKIAQNNDEEAIQRIRGDIANQQIEAAGVTVNMDGLQDILQGAYDSVADWAASLPEGDLDLNTYPLIQSLVTALQQVGSSAEQIEGIFDNLGIDIDLSQAEQSLQEFANTSGEVSQAVQDNLNLNATQAIQTTEKDDTQQLPSGYEVQFNEVPGQGSMAIVQSSTSTDPGGAPSIENKPVDVSYPQMTITAKPSENSTNTIQQTAMALKVDSAKKKGSGGNINTQNSTKKAGGGKGGGKGGKGGGKEQKPTKAKRNQPDRDARYHKVNKKISNLDKSYKDLQKNRNKAYGVDVKKILEEELKILQKQVEAEKEKQDLIKEEQKELQDLLKTQQESIDFDKQTGEITNYYEVIQQIEAKQNELADKWDSMSKEQQDNFKEQYQETKKQWEDHLKLVKRYVSLEDEMRSSLEKTAETIQQQFETKIEHFKVEIDLHLNFEQLEREWIDFEDKVINQLRDDDIFGNIESKLKNIYTYFEPDEGAENSLMQHLTDQITNTMQQIDKIRSGGTSDIYGNNLKQATQDLNNYNKQLQDGLKNYISLLNEIKQKYYDLANAAQEAFDMQEKRYSSLASWLEHDRKLLELIYGEKAYDKFEIYDKKIIENSKAQLSFHKEQKDFWWARMEAEKARMASLEEGSNAFKEAQDRFKDAEKRWLESAESFKSSIEDTAQAVINNYHNTVDKILDDLGKKLTGGKGLQPLKEEWELLKDVQDDYLDDVDRLYEIDKLENAVKDAMKDNQDNPKAQKLLNKFMQDRVDILKQQDKLTQYDIDHANKALEIELKRIALQDSRNNKTKLRLKRDAAGNYSYQFTADQSESENKLQELKDLQHSLYTLDKDQLQKLKDEYMSSLSDYFSKIAEMRKSGVDEEQIEKFEELSWQKFSNLQDMILRVQQNLPEDMWGSVQGLGDILGMTEEKFKTLSETQQQEFLAKVVPGWKDGVTEMIEKINGEGGLEAVCKEAFAKIGQATKEYESQLEDLQKTAGVSFEQLGKGIDDTATKTQELITENEGLISTYEEAFSTMDDYIDQIEKITSEYDDMKTAAQETAEAVRQLNRELSFHPEEFESENDEDEDQQPSSKKESSSNQDDDDKSDSSSGNNKSGSSSGGSSSSGGGGSSGGSGGSGSKSSSGGNNTSKESFYEQSESQRQAAAEQARKREARRKMMEANAKDEEEEKKERQQKEQKQKEEMQKREARRKMMEANAKDEEEEKRERQQRILIAQQEQLERQQEISDARSRGRNRSQEDDLIKKYFPSYRTPKRGSFLTNYKISSGATGMYTGEWGNEGKLAILHEKQLVLNKDDTANILSAVDLVRTLSNFMNSITPNFQMPNIPSPATENKTTLDQNVHITATFPNVQDHNEIEQALNNLINRASQYAFNTDK